MSSLCYSGNGEQHHSHVEYPSGQKRCFYEWSARIPLIIAYPDNHQAGRKVAEPVSMMDLVPTMLDMGGVDPADRMPMHAQSLAGLIIAAGISRVAGEFERGDPIALADGAGHELARGLAAYSSGDMRRIAGHRSSEIGERLGYTYGEEAVHRNNLVLLTG